MYLMKDGDILAAGSDNRIIGSSNMKTFKVFTKIMICEEEITWAAAGDDYTLYQTKSGRAILCHKDFGGKIEIQLQSRSISVFGGIFDCSIIDEDGCAHFIDINEPKKTPTPIFFDSPAVELVCSLNFKVVLLSDGRVFGNGRLNNSQNNFAQVLSLSTHKITKISGYADSCIALSEDGLAFSYGCNNYGQLETGSTVDNYENFTRIDIPGYQIKIKDIACSDHSLILSREGELFGCGWNKFKQLFHDSESERVQNVVQIDVVPKLSHVFAGNVHSIAVSGINLPINPAKAMFTNSLQNIRLEIRQFESHFSNLEVQMNQKNEELKINLEEKDQIIHKLEAMLSLANEKIDEMTNKLQQIDHRNEELMLMIQQRDGKIENMIEVHHQAMKSLLIDINDLGLKLIGPK